MQLKTGVTERPARLPSPRYLLGHLLHLGHVRSHRLLLGHPAQAVPGVPAVTAAVGRG